MKTRLQDLIDKKTLKLMNESVLGDLPSKKLMKMKWNPVTDKKSKVNEEYVEVMNMPELTRALEQIKKQWDEWKRGPLTEPKHVRPAQKELTEYITSWMKKNIK